VPDPARPGGRAGDALEQAAEWFAVLNDDAATEADQRRWREWLDASHEHRQAWARVERIDREFRSVPGRTARQALDAAGRSRRRLLAGLGCGALALPLGALVRQVAPPDFWRADLSTGTGEIESTTLPDGGRLWLNTRSAVTLDYTPERRLVTLLAGEIRIETAPERRAFEVETPSGLLRALGTRFGVRLQDAVSRIAVTAGRVAVSPGGDTDREVLVPAGERLRFDDTGVLERGATTAADMAWHRGVLVADDMRLAEFLDELARYRHGVIRYDAAAADLRLVGAYPLDDSDRILAAVEASLPVRVTRLTPWWIRVEHD